MRFHLARNIDISPDGRYVCASTTLYTYLWEIRGGRIIGKFPSHPSCSFLTTCFFSPDSKYMIFNGRNSNNSELNSKIFDIHRKKMILSSKYSTPEGFSPNSIYAVLEFSDSLSKVFLYNLTKNNFESHSLNTAGISSYFNEIKVLREQIDSCWLVLLRYCIREDNQCNFKEYLFIELHNLKKKKIDRKIKIALGDDFEQNTERVFTGGKKIFIFYPKKVLIVDMEKLKVKIVNFDDELWGTSCTPCCVSRDGKWIARFPFQNEKIKNGKKFVAKVYEAESGKLYSEIPVNCQRSVKYMALAPDKELLAIGFRRNLKSQGKIILYNINTKREIRELKLEI